VRLLCRYTEGSWLRINRTALSLYYDDELDYCEYQAIERPPPPPDGATHNDGGNVSVVSQTTVNLRTFYKF